jgi:hypothetical protein
MKGARKTDSRRRSEMQDETVRLRSATPIDLEFARAVSDALGEWGSKADQRAYADFSAAALADPRIRHATKSSTNG